MTKYCISCAAPKSEHSIYTVQGQQYANCNITNCSDETDKDCFKSKKIIINIFGLIEFNRIQELLKYDTRRNKFY